MSEHAESSAGVKSVQQAVSILEALAKTCGPTQLKEIAAKAGMAPSKAHRYLQSLCESGFVTQPTKSGAYDLGVAALRLGLAAVSRVDVVNRAGDALAELVEDADADAFLCVWGETSPVVVRFERSTHPATAMMGAGVSLPPLTSAAGLVFLAYSNPERARKLVAEKAGAEWRRDYANLSVTLARVREAGFAAAEGAVNPGRKSISAPIISFDDQVVASVSLVSWEDDLLDPEGDRLQRLLEFCRRHSVYKRGYMQETQIERRIAV